MGKMACLNGEVIHRRSASALNGARPRPLIVSTLEDSDTLPQHGNLPLLFLELDSLTFYLFVCNTEIGECISVLLC